MKDQNLMHVGKSALKVDGRELVTGKAKFSGDFKFPELLHGHACRSKIAAGYIKDIDVSQALKVPGVVDVILPKDIPGKNIIGILPPHDQPVLADKEIRYAGESYCLVIATSVQAAKAGAKAIKTTIEPITPILTIDESLAKGARKIHPSGNITVSKKLIKGDSEKAFAEADIVLEDTFETSNQEHAYMETEVVCAEPSGDGRVTVHASCQSPFHIRGHIAANLNVPVSRIKVVQAYTGGSFGGKDDVATEIGSLAAIVAVKHGKPVMICHERDESIVGSTIRHASRIQYRVAAKRDGTITGKEIKILLDGGAYAAESPFVVMKALIHSAGPYKIDNITVESTALYTNKTYCGAFRGFGVPQVTFASESMMDELAKKLNMDPLELRRKNALKPGEKNATSQIFQESVGLIETIDQVAKVNRSYQLPSERQDRYLYGTGFASMYQGISNGAEGIDVVGASVQAMQDGSALIGIGLTELGQGSRTVFAQIAAEVLGISMDKITIKQVDTDSVHDSGPTVASRSTTVGGMAVYKAAGEVKKSLLKMAALMFKTEEDNIILKNNFAQLVFDENAKIPLREVCVAAYWTGFPLMNLFFSKAPEANYDQENTQGNIYVAYNYGTHMMSIRIDKLTGEVKVLKHVAVHDAGKVVNPKAFEGQIEGASLTGFGLAHLEKIQYKDGVIQNPNLADYAVPTIKDRIPTETISVETYNPTGPYGVKGIGEPPVSGAAASFANAVAKATGIRFKKLPITRQDILKAIINK